MFTARVAVTAAVTVTAAPVPVNIYLKSTPLEKNTRVKRSFPRAKSRVAAELQGEGLRASLVVCFFGVCFFGRRQHFVWAVIFIPMPLPKQVLQTSHCTHSFQENVLQTLVGVGMGMNVTAHCSNTHIYIYIYIYIYEAGTLWCPRFWHILC